MKIRLRRPPTPVPVRTPERVNLELFLGKAPEPATRQQLKGIVHKIEEQLAQAMVEARSLGVLVDGPFVAELLDHLLLEAVQPGYQPKNDGSVRSFLMEGTFQELVQLPSNIFDRIAAVDGTEHYIPLTPETWISALEQVRTTLEGQKL